jgi:hypothetical protein
MALAHCILGRFLGVGCHCFSPPSDVPTFSARCLHVQRRERPLAAKGGTLRGWEMFQQISSRIVLEIFHMPQICGTGGFTSPPKEGMLRIFSPLKIWRLRPGVNLGTKSQHATSRPPKPFTFKYYIFLSHLLVCVPKLHELYFIIKEDKFLLSVHANTKPHSCAVCTHWCARDLGGNVLLQHF